MSAAKKPAIVRVYQLKIALRVITPLIWRRLRVISDTTIAQLHDVLQIAMGWEDLHLHQFRSHGKTYGVYRDGGISFADDPHQVILADFKMRKRDGSSTHATWATSGSMISGSNMLPKGHPCLSIRASGIRSAPPEMATVRIHLVTVADAAAKHQQPIADLVRTEATLETAGLTLAESKQVLHALQRRIVDQQVAGYRDAQRACPHCGKHRHLKERGIAPFCTLFGLVSVPNPRWHHCDCQPHEEETFRPLDYAEKGSSVADAARTQQHMRRATRCRGCPRFPRVTDRSDYWSPQASQ